MTRSSGCPAAPGAAEAKAQEVVRALRDYRFDLSAESTLQDQIAKALKAAGIAFRREHSLDRANRPDFMASGVAIEVKIQGSPRQIFRQCERYASFDDVEALCLVTNRAMGFPESLNGKPAYVVNLGVAWL